MKQLASLLAVGVLGLFIGDQLRPSPEGTRTEPIVVRAPAATHTSTTLDRAALRAEVRAALAELELPAAPTIVAPPPAEPTVEETRAAATGSAVVAEAMQRGRWQTAVDGARLREVLGTMTADQRMQTLDALMSAVNAGQLVPDEPVLF